MTFRYTFTKYVTRALSFVIHASGKGNGINLPGKVALKLYPHILSEASKKNIRGKSIVVVGTNGKTSNSNLIANIIEESGKTVTCNRSGANLKSGIVASLLLGKTSDYGVIECDELWLKEVMKDFSPDYCLLLNLFRDQLDRCGEIDRIQDSIIEALKFSPKTRLIYNADDPTCAYIASLIKNIGNRGDSSQIISFGLDEDLKLSKNSILDTTLCPRCNCQMKYNYFQYDKLGDYYCPECGFKRPNLDYSIHCINVAKTGIKATFEDNKANKSYTFSSHLNGTYNIYNMLACFVAATQLGIDKISIQQAFDNFNQDNGRLTRYNFQNRHVLLNLAKNPTGFNQNLRIIQQKYNKDKKSAIAFFINDKIADGRDVSWIWDVDFQELSDLKNTYFFVGGTRAHDMQVRLKYAGINSIILNSVDEILRYNFSDVFVVANYTALPIVKADLDQFRQDKKVIPLDKDFQEIKIQLFKCDPQVQKEPIKIAHIMPDLLNLYGDGGNIQILTKRLEGMGIRSEICHINCKDDTSFNDYDFIFLGGGPDREQHMAAQFLMKWKDNLREYVENDGAVLAICGGYQLLGKKWLDGDVIAEGLGILDIETQRAGTSADRLVGNIVLRSDLISDPIIGFENHASRTFLGKKVQPFGRVINKGAFGNNDFDKQDGAIYKNVIGTYLHGPLLSKNPELADHILKIVIENHNKRCLDNLKFKNQNNKEENEANQDMLSKMMKI